ncbi:MAG: glycosyltransferase family 2 protein [Spirochaetaceae bacterium]|nr:MAG: glycosyltransferase family 2 protein [Spirochaetaceae bacterium]
MNAPICSVIIPTYNRRRLLAEAVGSVLSQQGAPPLELIIVDDGSTDDTPDYLAKLTRATATRSGVAYMPSCTVTTLGIPHCGMPGAVRNRGVELARSTYLAFLDSDDLWLSSKLAAQLALHRAQPQLVLSHTREHWLRGTRIIKQPADEHPKHGDVFIAALEKCMIGPSTAVIKRSVLEELGGFREDIQVAEDYEFWLRLTAQHEVSFLTEPLIVKRAGHSAAEGEQLSERYGRIEFFRLRALAAFLSVAHLPPERLRLAHNAWREKCLIYAAGRQKRGHPQDAAELRQLAANPPRPSQPRSLSTPRSWPQPSQPQAHGSAPVVLPQALQFFPEHLG